MYDVFGSILRYPAPLDEISAFLDSLSNEERIAVVHQLSAAHQRNLFEAAKGYLPLDLEYFAPSSRQPLVGLPHHGKNSIPIPAFSRFQKVFCVPDRPTERPQRWGYNNFKYGQYVGPGYYVAEECGDGEVVVDYFRIPPVAPPGWPPLRENCVGLSRFIYCQTRDYLRGVSKHVSIGRATRNGKLMDNWFVLCRDAEGTPKALSAGD